MKRGTRSANGVAIVEDTGRYGLGLFATCDLEPGAVIARFDGPFLSAARASELPNDPPTYFRDRAIQCGPELWRDSDGVARCAYHSCRPNAGVRGNFDLVAMRGIETGEEITFDYDMTEDSDWRMDCICGDERCRGIIRGFRFLDPQLRIEYGSLIADWLIAKYRLPF